MGKVVLIVVGTIAIMLVGTCVAFSMLVGRATNAVADANRNEDPQQAAASVEVAAIAADVSPDLQPPSRSAEEDESKPSPAPASKPEAPAKPTSAWITRETTDSMSGQITKLASLQSANAHRFGWPYEGDTHASILMRTKGQSRDVIVTIDQGQIICHSFSACRVEVRFDDAPPEKYRGSESADNDSTVVFLSPASKFMAKAAKAKKIKIALTIYQEGTRIFEFETQSTEGAAPALAAESKGRVGVAECDEYIEKYTKCITLLPETARPEMMEALNQSADAWAEAARGPGRDSLAAGCSAAIKAARDSTAALGCSF